MRIVDRATFLAMPAGTIFAKMGKQMPGQPNLTYGDVAIKGDTISNDYVVQNLFTWFEGTTDTLSWMDTMFRMFEGEESATLDYDFSGRDGLFEQEQLFAVWSRDDARSLVNRLQKAFIDGYSPQA